jgi:hypothetical protein
MRIYVIPIRFTCDIQIAICDVALKSIFRLVVCISKSDTDSILSGFGNLYRFRINPENVIAGIPKNLLMHQEKHCLYSQY